MADGVARTCPRCGDPESAETGPIQPIAEDDPREVCARCYTEEFGRSSVVKLYAFIAGAQGQAPETEEDAQRHALLQMVAPMAGKFIPDDPDELDHMLLTLAKWSLSMRSDSAPAWSIVAPEGTIPSVQEVRSGEVDLGGRGNGDPPRNDPPPAGEGDEAPAVAGPDSTDDPPAPD